MQQLSRALSVAIIAFFVSNSAVSAQIQDYKKSASGYLEPVYDPSTRSNNQELNTSGRHTNNLSNDNSKNDYEPEVERLNQSTGDGTTYPKPANSNSDTWDNSTAPKNNAQSNGGFLSRLLMVESNPDGSVHIKAPFLNINTASGKVDLKLPLVNLNVNEHAIKVKAPLVDVKTNGGAVDVKAPFVHVNR